MHEPDLGEFEGLPALRRFAAEVGSWPEATPDWKWSARFNYQVIERRGTGGGNFRALYSRFLAEVGRDEDAALAAAAAAAGPTLAGELFARQRGRRARPRRLGPHRRRGRRVLADEERLWARSATDPLAQDRRDLGRDRGPTASAASDPDRVRIRRSNPDQWAPRVPTRA